MRRVTGAVALVWATWCGAVGCEADPIVAPDDIGAEDTRVSAVDTVAEVIDDGYITCGNTEPDTECPDGMYCERTAGVCVDCVGDWERCNDDGVRETCARPVATGPRQLEGGFWVPAPCPAKQSCVPDGAIDTTCEPIVCEAGTSVCDGTAVLRCSADGTVQETDECGRGRACFEGACEQVRHRVLLIFDTSTSMHDYIDPRYPGSALQCEAQDTPCIGDYPSCDDPDDPLTLLTLSKAVFSEVIQETVGGFSFFALQRFPQRERGDNPPNCWTGWYDDMDRITGDDDAWETAAGGWFDKNFAEAIVVRFPFSSAAGNDAALLQWLDHEERLAATDQPCESHSDCGSGRCGNVGEERRCFYHSNDELRANGETPLGKSLFYAGEYFRRHVVVDGKACDVNADCRSAGYLCRDGACVDPYGACRDNFIILFTDGEENHHPQETDFFNPVVQAKRLAYGLDCEVDDDCRGEATCVTGHCAVPDWNQTWAAPPRFDTGGIGALSTPDGRPFNVQVTVITLDQQAAGGTSRPPTRNERIAAAGGGAHLDVAATSREDFADTLRGVMRKDPKCAPEEL